MMSSIIVTSVAYIYFPFVEPQAHPSITDPHQADFIAQINCPEQALRRLWSLGIYVTRCTYLLSVLNPEVSFLFVGSHIVITGLFANTNTYPPNPVFCFPVISF